MQVPTYVSGVLHAKVSRMLQSMAHHVLQHYRLKPTQWAILGQLYAKKSGMRAADVAEALGVEAALVTMMVPDLVERDLVAKSVHQNDGRARVLRLTKRGRLAVEHIERVLNANFNQLVHDVSDDDLLAYRRVLEKIIAAGEANEPQASKSTQRQRRISSVVLLDNLG